MYIHVVNVVRTAFSYLQRKALSELQKPQRFFFKCFTYSMFWDLQVNAQVLTHVTRVKRSSNFGAEFGRDKNRSLVFPRSGYSSQKLYKRHFCAQTNYAHRKLKHQLLIQSYSWVNTNSRLRSDDKKAKLNDTSTRYVGEKRSCRGRFPAHLLVNYWMVCT